MCLIGRNCSKKDCMYSSVFSLARQGLARKHCTWNCCGYLFYAHKIRGLLWLRLFPFASSYSQRNCLDVIQMSGAETFWCLGKKEVKLSIITVHLNFKWVERAVEHIWHTNLQIINATPRDVVAAGHRCQRTFNVKWRNISSLKELNYYKDSFWIWMYSTVTPVTPVDQFNLY